MGFKGSLESINLADIFQNLALNQQTGTIKIVTGDENYYVYFDHGAVSLFSRDKDKGGKLGEMVVGRGLAEFDQVEEALRKHGETGKLLGEVLVEMGILVEEDVANLIRYQIEEAVYDLFHLDAGEFEFIDGAPLPEIFDEEQKAVQIGVNTSSLIMEAARRVDEWERMRDVVPSLEEIFLPQPALKEMAARGEMEPLAGRIFDFLDGGRDIQDVIDESSFSRYEVVRTIAGFLEQGLVRSATLDDLAEAGEMCLREGRTRHVIKIYERMLAKGVDTPDLRARLAEAATELGEINKAAIHYGVYAHYHLDKGNVDHGVTILQKIVKLIPKHVPSRTQLARILSSQGDIKEAIVHYTALVQALVDSRREEEALEFAREGLDLDPNNLDLLQALSHIHMANKDRPAASAVLYRMGEVLQGSGRSRAAVEMFRRGVQLDPMNEDAKAALATIEEKEKSERAKPVLVGVVLVMVLFILACGGIFGVNELLAKNSYATTVERYKSRQLNADDVWKNLSRPSVWVDSKEAVEALRMDALAVEEQVLLDKLQKKRRAMEIEEMLSAAEVLFEEHRHGEAAELYRKVVAEAGAPAAAERARGRLARIAEIDEYLQDYRKWVARFEGRAETLEEEHRRKKDLLDRYPWSEEAKSVKLPVLVKTDPEGADIYVGGRFRGSSPLPLQYEPGSRVEIVASKKGFRSVKKVITGQSDSVEISLTLEREAVITVSLGGDVDIPAGALENMIIAANRSGRLMGLDRDTGRELWSVKVKEQGLGDVTSPMLYYAGNLFFGVSDGTVTVFAVTRNAAKKSWSALNGANILSRPAVKRLELLNQKLFVFAADESGLVSCLEAENGTPVWSVQVSAGIESDLVATERYLYVPTRKGDLMVLESPTGREVKVLQYGQPISDLVTYGNRLYFASGRVVYCRDLNSPHAIPAWAYKMERELTAGPVIIGRRLYVCDAKQRLYCLDPESGRVVWAPLETEEQVVAAAGGDEDKVYIADKAGTLYVISGNKGRLRWKYVFRQPIVVPPMHINGRAYVITQSGTMYAFEDSGDE
ncbi:MAG: PQQ-binding-like beta-propeller repeat protein [Planctomycetes bacterium]|nr:PQQ-binding-like beta-propeller repeat protein [Planctomycetota bacterium]